jgi:hypothetical protein
MRLHAIWGALVCISLLLAVACSPAAKPASSSASSPVPASSPAPPSPAVRPLSCHASMRVPQPAVASHDVIRTRTASRAEVSVAARYPGFTMTGKGRAPASGRVDFRFRVNDFRVGRRVRIRVRVARGDRFGSCSTSYSPRKRLHAVLSCHASMSNDSPVDYTEDTVEVTTVPFAAVSAIAHYATTSTDEGGEADGSGNASVGYYISGATVGYPVSVSVTVTAGGQSATCSTSFTPSGS